MMVLEIPVKGDKRLCDTEAWRNLVVTKHYIVGIGRATKDPGWILAGNLISSIIEGFRDIEVEDDILARV